jgi:hypothetical protein
MANKKTLGNPAAIASAVSKSDTTKKVTEMFPFMFKTAIGVTALVIGYRYISTRFSSWKEVSNYPPANISFAQAKSKAESLYNSTGYFGYGNDFENIKSQLQNVNYNGFVRIYNAFNQKGNIITGYSDLISFLHSKLTNDQIQQLRFLLSGAFLKDSIKNVKNTIIEQQQQPKFLGV